MCVCQVKEILEVSFPIPNPRKKSFVKLCGGGETNVVVHPRLFDHQIQTKKVWLQKENQILTTNYQS